MGFSALEALQAFGAGRQMALQDRTQRRADTLREGLISAYDPQAGRMDPARARSAYLEGGDLPGLQAFDQAEGQRAEAGLEQHRDRIVQGARFLDGVQDETTYQQARRDAAAFGIDLSDVPENYDPAYVDSLRRAAAAFAKQNQAQPTEFQRNYDWLQRTNPAAAENYMARQTEQSPLTVRNDDQTITIIPRVPRSQTAPAGSARPQRLTPAQLRQQADEAIGAGAPRDAVEAELQRMLGGAGGNASGGFRP